MSQHETDTKNIGRSLLGLAIFAIGLAVWGAGYIEHDRYLAYFMIAHAALTGLLSALLGRAILLLSNTINCDRDGPEQDGSSKNEKATTVQNNSITQ